ncbi:MAG: V-type ATP synthase subunit K [Clostridiales bacterium]|nr:V-type ATP synthase subunit K [Clostridiales bacterium]
MKEFLNESGVFFAVLGAALAALVPGIASAKGVSKGGITAAGIITEDPSLFAKALILQLLPGTQGIYGLIIAFITFAQIGVLGGSSDISLVKGLLYLAACMPMTIVGYASAIRQANAAIASMGVLAKRPDQFGKSMIFPAMVETYAILALLISILAVSGISGINI